MEFGEAHLRMRYFLGIDAGGSNSRARLVDEQGRICGTGDAGTANTRIGIDASLAALRRAWEIAIAEAGLSRAETGRIHAAVGIAGYRRAGAADALARAATPFAATRYVSDAVIANIGAHAGEDGATLILGTGSIGIVRRGGEDFTLGGHGFPVSDEASGAWMGLEAVRHAVLAHDGRAQRGPLADALLGRFHGDPVQIVAWTDRATATDYARFAPEVLAAAADGDAEAQAIAGEAAAIAGKFLMALRAAGAERLCLMGGLGSALEPLLGEPARELLSPPRADALAGALMLAGCDPAAATASVPLPR